MINYSNFSNELNDFVPEIPEVREEQIDVEEIATIQDDTVREGVVARKKIYLREKPSKDSEALRVLSEGDEVLVDITKSVDEWYSVCTVEGIEGYVMADLLTIG